MPRITAQTQVFLRDCYDHLVQLIDMTEIYREVSGSLFDLHMMAVSNRMNEVMKVLTVIATIFMPLSFIASVYGMNFDPDLSPWNMPELRWYRSEEHTSELQSLMRISYAVFCLK